MPRMRVHAETKELAPTQCILNSMDFYGYLGMAMALFFGVGAAAIVVIHSIKSSEFLRKNYPLWVSGALVYCFVAPLVYMATSPQRIAYVDALALRELYAGWRHVLVAYATFGGIVIGGLIAVVRTALRRRSGN